jgi:hypothetical protein
MATNRRWAAYDAEAVLPAAVAAGVERHHHRDARELAAGDAVLHERRLPDGSVAFTPAVVAEVEARLLGNGAAFCAADELVQFTCRDLITDEALPAVTLEEGAIAGSALRVPAVRRGALLLLDVARDGASVSVFDDESGEALDGVVLRAAMRADAAAVAALRRSIEAGREVSVDVVRSMGRAAALHFTVQ